MNIEFEFFLQREESFVHYEDQQVNRVIVVITHNTQIHGSHTVHILCVL